MRSFVESRTLSMRYFIIACVVIVMPRFWPAERFVSYHVIYHFSSQSSHSFFSFYHDRSINIDKSIITHRSAYLPSVFASRSYGMRSKALITEPCIEKLVYRHTDWQTDGKPENKGLLERLTAAQIQKKSISIQGSGSSSFRAPSINGLSFTAVPNVGCFVSCQWYVVRVSVL